MDLISFTERPPFVSEMKSSPDGRLIPDQCRMYGQKTEPFDGTRFAFHTEGVGYGQTHHLVSATDTHYDNARCFGTQNGFVQTPVTKEQQVTDRILTARQDNHVRMSQLARISRIEYMQ